MAPGGVAKIDISLFVKAQILWEGYQNTVAAKQCLIHLMKVDPDRKASVHRWALSLYREIASHGQF